MGKSENSGFFLWEKVKTVDFSETIAAYDLKVGRCRQLIVIMKVHLYASIHRSKYYVTQQDNSDPLGFCP